VEQIPLTHLHARLKQLSAQYQPPPKSSNAAHIYWAAPSQRWIKVVRSGQTAKLTYHTTCPCSGG
jgi:hypothetical protein